MQTNDTSRAPASIEEEVLSNVRSQPLGAGTVEDLALPEPFLRRIADRVVRSSFEERFRVVIADQELEEMARKHDGAAQAGSASTAAESATPSRAKHVVFGGTSVAVIVAIAVAVRRRRRNA